MEIKKIQKHRTLQGKRIILLLLPVFLIIFFGGTLSFLYTRTALINQWNESTVLKLQRAVHYIQDHDGIIVDFFGDSILVFFDPITGAIEDKVFCAIQCASRMQSEMAAVNEKMRLQQMPWLDMGIGINSGQVVVGNIGSDTRSKYGVVGSAVNITNRIQAKAQKNEILISDSVYAYVRDKVDITKKFTANLKGVEGSTTLRAIKTIYTSGK